MSFIKFFTSINFHPGMLETFNPIYVLVSGGIDSTLLYEQLRWNYPEKVVPVNCYNPYEQNPSLEQIKRDPKFIQIKNETVNYGEILRKAFMKIPRAKQLRRMHKYDKTVFGCCRVIKHKAFFANSLFTTPGSVVVSGIKDGDGKQRHFFLTKIRQQNTHFYKHRGGQLYCYPFRDYYYRAFPIDIVSKLREKYPNLQHSGCSLCPVLVVFGIKSEGERYWRSLRYYHSLVGQNTLCNTNIRERNLSRQNELRKDVK